MSEEIDTSGEAVRLSRAALNIVATTGRQKLGTGAASRIADLLSALIAERDKSIARVEELERLLTKSGVAEIAARNANVMDYMRHWEGRAEKAEAEVERLRNALHALLNCPNIADRDPYPWHEPETEAAVGRAFDALRQDEGGE